MILPKRDYDEADGVASMAVRDFFEAYHRDEPIREAEVQELLRMSIASQIRKLIEVHAAVHRIMEKP